MQQAYINSFFQYCPSVYGLQLKPLTLGNTMLLEMIESPVFYGLPLSYKDVLTAAFICSNTFEENIRALSNGKELVVTAKRWGKLVARAQKKTWLDKLLFRKKAFISLDAERATLEEYVKYYRVFPLRWTTETSRTADKMPWEITLANILLDKFTETEVWNMPLTRVVVYVEAVNLVATGKDSDLMTDEEIDFVEADAEPAKDSHG